MSDQNSSPWGKLILILFLVGVFGVVLAAAGTIIYLNRDKLNFASNEKSAADSESTEEKHPARRSYGSPPPPPPQLAALAEARRPVAASAPVHADEATYRRYLDRKDVLVLVDYYADWCGPCRAIAPALSRLASAHGDKVVVLKINIDREPELAASAGARAIPDVRLLHGGTQLERSVGGRPYSYYEHLVLKHASRLPAPSSSTAPSAPARPASSGGSISPLKKDWLPPGVRPAGS